MWVCSTTLSLSQKGGIFSLLEEECVFPKATDNTFLAKVCCYSLALSLARSRTQLITHFLVAKAYITKIVSVCVCVCVV